MLDRIALTLRLLPALPKLVAHKPDSKWTVADRMEEQATRHSERVAVRYLDRGVTYAALNANANRVANWGLEAGLVCGDVVALLMENRPEYIETWAGLAKLGVTVALINTNLTGRGLEHALETAKARQLIVGSECLDRYATVADALGELPVWVRPDPDAEPAALPEGARDLTPLLAAASDANPSSSYRESLVARDSLFYIYTSGTTGLPKAARFSHQRFLAIGDLTAFAVSLGSGDVFYCALPLYHSAGGVMLVSSSLASGATIALTRKFSASRFWDEVRLHQATHFQYIGEFCRYLMNQPPRRDDREHKIRTIIGNGLRPDIWEAFQERFGIESVREFYGATEGNTAIVNFENKVGSVGRMPLRRITNARVIRFDVEADEHVRGADGLCLECAPDEIGELVGTIPSNANAPAGHFEGYTSKEASDRKILRDVFAKGDACFRSGDLLSVDRDGFFYFHDRIGDTFRWKGENVSTQEVAELLSGFPGLEMTNVYGVEVEGADGRAGMAAVVLAPGVAFDGEAFFAYVADHLPRYASPQFVRILPEQEVTGTFKIRKVDLQREGFDPDAIDDALYLRDEASRSYLPLTRELYEAIRSGERSL